MLISERFKILTIIGEGGTSTVYRALDKKENAVVAIKTQMKNKTNECDILGSLQYEHIVKLKETLAVGEHLVLMIMEEYENDLLHFMNIYDVDMKGVKRIARMVLLSLKFLHDRGIIHRDVKMGNILVKGNIAVLCDFGLSCYESMCDYGYCGTHSYLAPEMVRQAKYSTKIDMYALGVVLKMMLARRGNYSGEAAGGSLGDDNDHDIAHLLAGLLEDDPEKRLDAGAALKEDAFNELFVEVPDFRLRDDFEKCTKHGKIEKKGQHASLLFGSKFIEITCKTTCCKCKGKFEHDISIDNRKTEKYFLSTTELKYFNYLCTYLWILASKTVVYKEVWRGYAVSCFCDGSMEWKTADRAIKLDRHGRFGGAHAIPGEDIAYIAEKLQRTCYCRHLPQNEKFSTIQCTMSAEDFTDSCVYEASVGWCCKRGDDYLFLLNNGAKFQILGMLKILVIGAVRYRIQRAAPEEMRVYLKTALLFLRRMAKASLK